MTSPHLSIIRAMGSVKELDAWWVANQAARVAESLLLGVEYAKRRLELEAIEAAVGPREKKA